MLKLTGSVCIETPARGCSVKIWQASPSSRIRRVIKKAKDAVVIKSTMSDKQIALIFISTGDRVVLNLIFGGKYENLKKELVSLWDGFYKSIKA